MENELNPESSESSQPKPYRRKIWVTVILSLFDPGLALIYSGNLKAGIYVTSGLLVLYFIAISLMGISFAVFAVWFSISGIRFGPINLTIHV
jgi:hypothetical protein